MTEARDVFILFSAQEAMRIEKLYVPFSYQPGKTAKNGIFPVDVTESGVYGL